jgi:hypothetical protein
MRRKLNCPGDGVRRTTAGPHRNPVARRRPSQHAADALFIQKVLELMKILDIVH